MPTNEESGSTSSGSQPSADDVQYLSMTAKTIRGREGATRTKWENQGWQFVSQTQGTLRTELAFRKVKPKGVGARLAQGYAAFRGLKPTTQRALGGGVIGLVGLLIIGGIVAALAGSGDEQPEPTRPAAASEKTSATPEPTEAPITAPAPPEAEPYSYNGPKYEVTTVDDNQGPAKLSQYWIHTAPDFDFSKATYKDQVKLIIADIAHEQGTVDFIAHVVTNPEIAEAESPSTYQDFIAKHGNDYAINTIPKLEAEGWIASYTGGFDPDAGTASTDASAYEIIWRPYATGEIETWKPVWEKTPADAVDTTKTTKPKPAGLQERTAIDFLAKAWEERFAYGGDVHDLVGLRNVEQNSDGSYYIEVEATVENDSGNEFDAVITGTVNGSEASPQIKTSTVTAADGTTIDYFN